MKINFDNITPINLAGLICETLTKHAIDAILVGGTCVSIYSNNQYLSYDLDIVSYADKEKITKALAEIGFIREGRYYKNPDCDFYVDFVTPPVAVGHQLVNDFAVKNLPTGQLRLLKAIDCIKDRLAAYFYWNDRQALEQAVSVAQMQQIDLEALADWVKNENPEDKYQHFLEKLKK